MELSDIQLGSAVAVFLGAEVLDDHKAEAHDDAGDDTAGEHLQDGDIGDDGIHEHGAAGRNNEAQQTGGSDNSCGIFFLITGFFHGLYHDAADGSGRSGSGTGDSAEEHASQSGDHGKAAFEPAYHTVGQVDELIGNTAQGHDFTGQGEHGNSQQRELADAAEELLGDDKRIESAALQNGEQRGGAHRHADRNSDKEQNAGGNQQECSHAVTSSFPFLAKRSAKRSTMRRMKLRIMPTAPTPTTK